MLSVPMPHPALPRPHQVRPKIVKPRGRRGWGGPWRAFVRLKTFGMVGRPDLSLVKPLYAAAIKEGSKEIEHCKKLGEAAQSSGAAFPPKAGMSTFGPKTQQLQRARRRRAREALCQSVYSDDREKTALALADRVAAMGTDLRTSLSLARSTLRVQEKRSAQKELEEQAVLKAFEDDIGQQRLRHLQSNLPGVDQFVLKAVPSPSAWCFECAPSQQGPITKCVAWAMGSRETNLSASLGSHWEQLHQVSQEHSASKSCSREAETACRQAGRCLCASAGTKLKDLRATFLRMLKKAFPANTDARQCLVSGYVVAKLIGTPGPDDQGGLGAERNSSLEAWLHIGRMQLSPFRPTFLLLEVNNYATEKTGFDDAVFVKVEGAITSPPTGLSPLIW